MNEIYGYKLTDIDNNNVTQWVGSYPVFRGKLDTNMHRTYLELMGYEFNDALEIATQIASRHKFEMKALYEADWKATGNPIGEFFKKLFHKNK